MKRKCEACSVEFESKRQTAFFCSARCRQRSHRENVADNAAYWRSEALKYKAEAAKEKPSKPFKEVLEVEMYARYRAVLLKYPSLTKSQRAVLQAKLDFVLDQFDWVVGLEQLAAGYAEDNSKRFKPTAIEIALAELGLTWPATQEAATQAYRAKARELHPDINPAGAEKMKIINGAFVVVKEYFSSMKARV